MNLSDNIRYMRNSFYCLPWKILKKTNLYKDVSLPIQYVSENADWAIKTVGENIKREIDNINPDKFEINTKPWKIVNKIVHFGSQYMWLNWGEQMSKDNYFISTFYKNIYVIQYLTMNKTLFFLLETLMVYGFVWIMNFFLPSIYTLNFG